MGRSKVSCFKIIACGSDSAENEDTQQASSPPEYKGSSDKRGWSFRKRSARHRVLSNTVETPSSTNKEIPEIVINNLETQPKETLTEKPPVVTWTEETPQPNVAISKLSDTTVASEIEELHDSKPDESDIVVIQAAIRGFLAKRQMVRVKNVVKLQAAVRGHLVRNHAVGTLKCVQAIVKMQGLVRARQARIYSTTKPLDKETSVTKPRVEYISIEKLLANKFAHQLLESTPRSKHINIKCDPSSKSDSAWNWLERWMLVSSNEPVESPSEFRESTDLKDNYVETTIVDGSSPTPNSGSFSKNDITEEVSSELISGENTKPESVSEVEPETITTNSVFIAVQKIEESSITPSLANSESIESEILKREVRTGGSECGTEISVTSALDSPDDAELAFELEKEGSGDSNICDEEAKADLDTDISNSVSLQPEKIDNVNVADAEESAVLVTTVSLELEKQNLEPEESKEKIDLSMEPDHQASAKSSPRASPNSQMKVPEFQVTPSSQVSVKTKRIKSDKKSSNRKTKSSSPGISSPSNPNQNSVSKNSLDGFSKAGKRRNSFGAGKSDYADQEPRDSSSSSNTLPSYMQATESARMKLLANNSPRSSPDLQEKEIHVKKRYSLPGANGKQDSPRLQNSKSQAHQGAKANGHSQEKKWQR